MSRVLAILALAGVAVLLFSGCVSLTPAQKSRLVEYETFAHKVTVAYRKPDVSILVGDTSGQPGVSFMRPDGVMVLSPAVLLPTSDGLNRDFAFAHELGHYVSSHRPGCGVPCELEANAEAVKILMIGNGWTETVAFDHAVRFLGYVAGLQARGRPVLRGHLPACEELADLAKRYPLYPATGSPC